MIGVIALPEFIIQKQKEIPATTGAFSRILRDIGLSSKIVQRAVSKAGISEILGVTGAMNIQGEEVYKLDEFANNRFIAAFKTGGECAGVASEEEEDIVVFKQEDDKFRRYVVAIDPLDGSSNIDVNISVGTIFTIYERITTSGTCTIEDFLQKGIRQVAAGYIIYGSSTMLVYTTGYGVNGFTLDPSIGEFILTHPNIRIPRTGSTYSVNEGQYGSYSEGVRRFIDYCKEKSSGTDRPFKLRYVGSMVADIHRTLIKGGIFMYPATSDSPSGKLRLLYEANPMAFIVEQAGGMASNGSKRILEIEPKKLHERVPLFIGSPELVAKAEEFIRMFG
ncbi:MAG: class 1 fructose-bisphosphatase [Candidatus Caldarchaeum sp.]